MAAMADGLAVSTSTVAVEEPTPRPATSLVVAVKGAGCPSGIEIATVLQPSASSAMGLAVVPLRFKVTVGVGVTAARSVHTRMFPCQPAVAGSVSLDAASAPPVFTGVTQVTTGLFPTDT